MDETPETRRSLIVRLADAEDSRAWREFVALYEPLVLRLARRKGLQDADARDVCQEVFRAVAGAVGRWDPDRGSFRGWLSTIARNLLINFLSRRREPRGTGATSMVELLNAAPADDPSATATFEREYRRRLLRWACDEARGESTPAAWRAFEQTAVEGRAPADVAAELGVSVGAVYIARSRVLARIRRKVQEHRDHEPDDL
jgi:RNA polymerase sigma factor (sigma-70 family)